MTEMERIAIESARKLSMYSLPENCVKPQRRKAAATGLDDATKVVQSALREFGELACKAVCDWCEEYADESPTFNRYTNDYIHRSRSLGGARTCKASAIRKLMATEIERG